MLVAVDHAYCRFSFAVRILDLSSSQIVGDNEILAVSEPRMKPLSRNMTFGEPVVVHEMVVEREYVIEPVPDVLVVLAGSTTVGP
jgi:hypothetical protein